MRAVSAIHLACASSMPTQHAGPMWRSAMSVETGCMVGGAMRGCMGCGAMLYVAMIIAHGKSG